VEWRFAKRVNSTDYTEGRESTAAEQHARENRTRGSTGPTNDERERAAREPAETKRRGRTNGIRKDKRSDTCVIAHTAIATNGVGRHAYSEQ